jgi:hypothetical protein
VWSSIHGVGVGTAGRNKAAEEVSKEDNWYAFGAQPFADEHVVGDRAMHVGDPASSG